MFAFELVLGAALRAFESVGGPSGSCLRGLYPFQKTSFVCDECATAGMCPGLRRVGSCV